MTRNRTSVFQNFKKMVKLMKKDLESLTQKVDRLEKEFESPVETENRKFIDNLTQRVEDLEHKHQLQVEMNVKELKNVIQKLETLERAKIDDMKLTHSLAEKVDNLQDRLKLQEEISDLMQKIIIKQFASSPSHDIQLRVVPAVEEDVVFYARKLIESYRWKNPNPVILGIPTKK
ncbi:Oidioi.mRNA.OKI2018_I69.chr2.g6293.t1.cds [Oikopleura dioica]|uniref:Oidioi.mRNA.OKI2018_I69.chr2.g6293.t1.cds n=1 Tax=Oikopleura dioica TaxID=34765 RepID=A0ABN7T675_OIKDI|nr:Oidioi.mRNA.OKI2018_I69.chr2.g6293.t1.cds [Oikopleura dioica]